ncbi:hypothetical protein MBLNU459_g4931t1 [Dothideomycetes sp. NU459]
MSWRDPRTANADQSIWRDIDEDTFRKHLVDLETRTNAVPLDMQTFSVEEWLHTSGANGTDNAYTLPLEIEQQLADDFAFLAALEEGAQSVAAACLEEHIQPPGLTVRFGALDMFLNDATKFGLQDISVLLASAAQGSRDTNDMSGMKDVLFRRILEWHRPRLLGRLRSVKWQKPKHLSKSHKHPLWTDFANLAHRVQHAYTKKEILSKRSVESLVKSLGSLYENFETVAAGSQDESTDMLQLVKSSFDFCLDEDIRDYARRLEENVGHRITKQVASAIKCLRQIEKIAAYWRVPIFLVETAIHYPALFRGGVRIEFLTPYASVPTAIAYETWAQTCHVHAEVQLAVYYDLIHPSERSATLLTESKGEEKAVFRRPRAIGTSKYLCYLCYQFLRAHRLFFPANTHGRLYDQWTIPDLLEFDTSVLQRYRDILRIMTSEVECTITACSNSSDTTIAGWRPEPMTSRQNLLDTETNLIRLGNTECLMETKSEQQESVAVEKT